MTNPMENPPWRNDEEEPVLYVPPVPAFDIERVSGLAPGLMEKEIMDLYQEQTIDGIFSHPATTGIANEDIIKLENKISLIQSDDINTIGAKKYSFTMELSVPSEELQSAYEAQLHEKIAALGLHPNVRYSLFYMDTHYEAYEANDPEKRKFVTGGVLVRDGEAKMVKK